MLTIAHAELLQLFRNRSVLISGLVMPLAASIYFIASRDTFGEQASLGYISAMLVFTIAAFGLYATTVTTLAGRRQSLFLKRLRSTAASDGAILAGLMLPITAVSLVQVTLMLVTFGTVSDAPADLVLLLVAVASSFVMMLAFGLATAGVTRSPEQAQVTSLPLSLGIIAVVIWVGLSGIDDLTWLKRLLPGGAASELVASAWNGGAPLGDSLRLLPPTLAWVAAAIAVAMRMFAWEPRR